MEQIASIFYWDITQPKIGSGSGGILGADGIFSVDLAVPSVWKRDAPDYRVPIRVYYPERLQEKPEKLPVLLYLHGGGFVFISNRDLFYDIMSRNFAVDGDMIVVSVDYRLAPEHRFPAALLDAYSAATWIFNDQSHEYAKYFDLNRVAVSGDSCGAMISLGLTMLARDRGDLQGAFAAQALMYPSTYYNESTPSLEAYGDDAYLLPQGMRTAKWFHQQYTDSKTNLYRLADEDDADRELADVPDAQPMTQEGLFPFVTQPYLNPWAADSVAGLPFTHIISAQYDPLHDENVLFHKYLEKSGVKTKFTEVEKTVHGFFVLPFLNETRVIRADILSTLQDVFSGKNVE